MILDDININLLAHGRKTVYKDHWGTSNFVPIVNKLYYIYEGEISFTLKGTSYRAKAGDMVLMPLHTQQSYEIIGDKMDHIYWHFTLPQNTNSHDLLELYSYVPVQAIKYEACHLDLPMALKRKHHLMMTLCTYFHSSPLKEKLPYKESHSQLKKSIDYIQSNLQKKMTIEELAGTVNLHPNYFIRLFKKNYGLSPIKYINTLKINMAKDQLNHTNKSVATIADELGYDIYYFSKLFKQLNGMSPAKYRQT